MANRQKAFMEITIDGKCVGTLTFTLFSDYVPRTCENFMGYIKGEDESGNKLVDPDGLPQHYLGGEFRRVIPGFMAQGVLPYGSKLKRADGSEIKNSSDLGKHCIWTQQTAPADVKVVDEGGCLKFNDENFKRTHDDRGYLSMANRGPGTNGAQFFMLFDANACQHLNGKHVVFGRVDMNDEGKKVLDLMEAVGNQDGTTKVPVLVSKCGELKE